MIETLRQPASRKPASRIQPESARSVCGLEEAAARMGVTDPTWLLLMCEHGMVPFVQLDGGPPRISAETVAKGRPNWSVNPFEGMRRPQIVRELRYRRDRIAGWRRGERWLIPVRTH